MSDTEESQALLADEDKNLDADDDGFAGMQQMMGFSSFGGPQKPKRQPRGPKPGKGFGTGANSQPVQQRQPSSSVASSTLSATSHPFTPASLPPRPQKQVSETLPASIRNDSYLQSLHSVQAAASPQSSMSSRSALNPASAVFNLEPAHSQSVGGASALSTTAELESTHDQHSTDALNDTWTTPTHPASLGSGLEEVAYTNPTTQYTLTRWELAAYEHGVMEQVVNNDGSTSQVKVYFKPNFIMDNPWEKLEVAAGLRKAVAGTGQVAAE